MRKFYGTDTAAIAEYEALKAAGKLTHYSNYNREDAAERIAEYSARGGPKIPGGPFLAGRYIVGEPLATEQNTSEQIAAYGIVGIYRVDDVVEPLTYDAYWMIGEWSPHAIYSRQIEQFDQTNKFYFEDADDLDSFRVLGAVVNGKPMAVINYRGYPNGATSLFLPFEVTDPDEINASVELALVAFGLDRSEMTWERKDGLDDDQKADA